MSDIKIGLIGGSGLGKALVEQTQGDRHDLDTPFGKPSDAIIETQWSGLPILFLNRHGPGHSLNPSEVPYRANIFALKQLGCTHILASGAVGSLREEYQPRHLVIPDQLIDRTYRRDPTFFDRAAVHVEFAEPFCPVLRRILIDAGKMDDQPTAVHDGGCYVCMEGPAFSTRAESLMHRLWGGDLIGMTLMPEAKLAKEAEISYAHISLVTDYDSWRPHAAPAQKSEAEPPLAPIDPFKLLNEIMGNLQTATDHAITLMRRAVELMSQRLDELKQCPAAHALRLAIWSDKNQIPQDQRQRLAPLCQKYFES